MIANVALTETLIDLLTKSQLKSLVRGAELETILKTIDPVKLAGTEYESYIEWSLFNYSNSAQLLIKSPNLHAQIDINKIPSSQWMPILTKHPSLVNECPHLMSITGLGWATLINKHPELQPYCHYMFNVHNWVEFIRARPIDFPKIPKHIIHTICNSTDVSVYRRTDFLLKFPQVEDQFNFTNIGKEGWYNLVSSNPKRFAHKCDWDLISPNNKKYLIDRHPIIKKILAR